MRKLTLQQDNNCDAGAVLVEWAIVSAGMLLGFLLFFDTARALNNYLMLSHIVSEGAKMGARIPELESAQSSYIDTDLSATQANRDACAALTTTTFPCGHDLLQQRLRFLINALPLDMDKTTVQITTSYRPEASPHTEQDDVVTIRIGGWYRGMLLRIMPLSATKQAPYLFKPN